MFLPMLAVCLAAAMIAAPPGRATEDPSELTDGLYVGHELGKQAVRVSVELRGRSMVILDPRWIGIASLAAWELAGPGGKGGDLQWKTTATPRVAASRAGQSKGAGRSLVSAVRLRFFPATKAAVLCTTEPRKQAREIARVPPPGAGGTTDPGVTCYDLRRVWSPMDDAGTPAPTPPEPDFECMRECRMNSMPRAVSPEVIEEDCRRACTKP